ncbi:MAG: hypothetical protein HZB76_05295 [Chlamydiae bacterium]|nr:hypothetical protein [Chlamydiota bacterium]
MAEIKKNKICLSDYNYKKDIENRLLISTFSTLDLQVLEEILYSPATISLKRIAKNLNVEEKEILPILKKLEIANLLKIENDLITVDKKVRKYFEFEFFKFDENFKPDMEFLQGLLQKVPIHILPSWYPISKSSDNIFDSIIEKYLLTPNQYQNYLNDLCKDNPIFSQIIKDSHSHPSYKISSDVIRKKCKLSKEQFTETLLFLEYSFACCISYEKIEEGWQEIVTPFYEWAEYLKHQYSTTSNSLKFKQISSIKSDFCFIEALSDFLAQKKSPNDPILKKAEELHFIEKKRDKYLPNKKGQSFLKLSLEKKAMHLYLNPTIENSSSSEKQIKEAEKSILKILNLGWVEFEDFLKGVTAALNSQQPIKLKKNGKNYSYELPKYSQDEINLLKTTIFEHLFQAGIVNIGKYKDKECFSISDFGKTLFEP